MRPIIHVLRTLFLCGVILVSSCGEKEPDAVCSTNTQSKSNGTQACGTSKVVNYSKSGNEETVRLQIAGGYEVTMYKVDAFQEGTEYTPYSMSYTNANRNISNSLTFVKFDRTAKIISVKYRFENEVTVGIDGTAVIVDEGQATDLAY